MKHFFPELVINYTFTGIYIYIHIEHLFNTNSIYLIVNQIIA